MKIYFLITIFNIVLLKQTQQKHEAATLAVPDRVSGLQWPIAKQMNEKSKGLFSPIVEKDDDHNYEYTEMRNQPITIMDRDEGRKDDKFKLRDIKSNTRDIRVVGLEAQKNPLRQKKPRPKMLRASKSDITDIFYRRTFNLEDETLAEWTFCQDLITPFLQGYKKNIKGLKVKTTKDSSVLRLIQLLNINSTDYTKDEIYSVLYQISNVQIRLYQWDTLALKLLFRTICPTHNGTHSYTLRDVRIGLQGLFNSWNLEFENTVNILKETRIFRPPCLRAGPYEGSTKTSRVTTYTKPRKEKKKCLDNECDYD